MERDSDEVVCSKCTNTRNTTVCGGCERLFCRRHFMKHRLYLSEQMDDLYEKYERVRQDVHRETLEYPLLTRIYAWERTSMRKIQEIAEDAREDLRKWVKKTKKEATISLDQIKTEFELHEKFDDFTEIELQKLTKQLDELRHLLEHPPAIAVVQDKKSSSISRGIQVTEHIESIPEHFVSIFGPCKLSDDNRVVTHSNYRAGLSQISGHRSYSSGKYSIDFLIENKGSRNIFFGIQSGSNELSSTTFDQSIHGWWNFDYVIINGQSQGGDQKDIIQTGDKITLIIDCDQQQIQLENHRTQRLVSLVIQLDLCPFPWKILLRLLNTDDCIRIL